MTSLDLVRQLRDIGVHRAEFWENDISSDQRLPIKALEFFAPTPPADASPSIPKAMELGLEPGEKCPCGHTEFQHDGQGLCLAGCPVPTCIGKPSEDTSGKTP